jgi:hypothetical protein
MLENKRGDWVKLQDVIDILFPLAYDGHGDSVSKKSIRDILQTEIWGNSIRTFLECRARIKVRVNEDTNSYLPLKEVFLKTERSTCQEISPSGRSKCFLVKRHFGQHKGTLILKSGDTAKISWR